MWIDVFSIRWLMIFIYDHSLVKVDEALGISLIHWLGGVMIEMLSAVYQVEAVVKRVDAFR